MDWMERYNELVEEAKALVDKPDVTKEDLGAAEAKMREAEEVKSTFGRVQSLRDSIAQAKSVAMDSVPRAPVDGAKQPAEFKDWTEFLKSIWRASSRHPQPKLDPRLTWFGEAGEEKALSGNDGADGGFLIPPQFQATLMAAAAEGSIVRGGGATPIPMSARTVDIPALDQTGVTEGMPAWFGGLAFYWVDEGEEKPESQAKFRMISLKAKKLVGYTVSGDELVSDSAISLSAFLAGPQGFAGGIRFMEDWAFLRGVGGGMPLGILNAPVTIEIARQAADTIGYIDLLNMMARILDLNTAQWVINRMALPELMQMEGPSGNPSYLWGNAVAGVPTTLLGLPVKWTEKLPAVGSRGDVLLANMREYLIGDRQATTIETTQFDRWRYDQTSWRGVHRVDGQPWLAKPIPLMDSDDTISPFVVLGDPEEGEQ